MIGDAVGRVLVLVSLLCSGAFFRYIKTTYFPKTKGVRVVNRNAFTVFVGITVLGTYLLFQ
ncbi:hypothetical protein SAMN05421687_11523 [Salimicrobium flavidum]|uniref:Uncharacterized protein n=2 Tax=Salimicrobium flavidum TaxID=570947 RepID=A0A1N7KPM3_9BACI|nr:hypothetical protein SAMN05421687_11523 [Salimicrobium flavidum]